MRNIVFPVAVLLASTALWSQTPGGYVRIQTQHIKPEHGAEFREVRRQIKAGYAKANRKDSVQVYRDTGNNDYRIITTMDKLAGLDQPAGLLQLPEGQSAALRARIATYSSGTETKIYRTYPELSVGAAEPMKYTRTNIYHVRPGNVDKLIELYKEALPAAKSAGLKRLRVSRLVIGGDFGEVRVSSGFDKFADLDGQSSFAKGLGDKYQKWLERLTPLITYSEVRVGEYLPELSHNVPAR